MNGRCALSRRCGLALTLWLAVAASLLISRPAVAAGFMQVNLVSDLPGLAAHTDTHLVNPWGIATLGTNPFWISDNGTGVSTIYDGNGVASAMMGHQFVVTIPPPMGGSPPSAPTGVVANPSMTGFVVTEGMTSGSSFFIFATEDGTIAGWNPTVDSTHAILAVDRSPQGAVYKGLALQNGFLYANNFRAGTVEVFDSNFTLTDSLSDPSLPPGYAPFGIQVIGGTIYVTFAEQNAERKDDVAGPGHGFVDTLDPTTKTFTRLISGHPASAPLNSPWGLAIAPLHFGAFSNDLLVGNFGDGRINAFDPSTGAFLGRLTRPNHQPVQIDGLWGLLFGNGGGTDRPTNQLFFTAGIDDEAHGLFGKLVAVP